MVAQQPVAPNQKKSETFSPIGRYSIYEVHNEISFLHPGLDLFRARPAWRVFACAADHALHVVGVVHVREKLRALSQLVVSSPGVWPTLTILAPAPRDSG